LFRFRGGWVFANRPECQKTMSTMLKSSWREIPPVLARRDCTLCRGTGWELLIVSGLSRARRCGCLALERLLKLKEIVRMPRRYEHCSLGEFRPLTLSQTRALGEAQRFAERFPEVTRGLFFCGPPGVGKTHLAVAIVQELLQRFHEDLLFVDFESLAYRHACPTRASHKREDLEWGRMTRVSLLILDNFGQDAPSRDIVRMTEELLHARRVRKKASIFTGDAIPSHASFPLGRAWKLEHSPTQNLLCSLSANTVIDLFASVRVVHLHGADHRKLSSDTEVLFQNRNLRKT